MKVNWLDTTEYPFQSRFFDVNGQRLHYIDEGAGEIIVFVHGTPSWSFDYRNVIKKLRTHYRCIAIDHIGFGLSGKPKHYDYSTINHSRTLEAFIQEKNLSEITLVVHDFGGPIGLSAAMHFPERIKNIVVLNSWLWSSAQEMEFVKLSKILKSPLLPILYRYFNFSPRYILPQSFGDKKLPKALRSQYTKPFADKNQRNGTIAFARSLLNDQDWFEELWQQRHLLTQKPILLIWGMKDQFIHPTYLQKFASGFPHTCFVELPTCGHFPQEEEPEKVAEAIRNFVQRKKYPQPA
jgi:pimeloyl-ACP methyl ester carboxylesterase